ncbi:unnamed protein product [Cylindrotheca closterium]|uniref:Uncharacterized protein n=2 Tax=Cylindrotheca closterium TaxID=2856 RepID=A0AAD2G1F3_9STRA|nr:unnamed protein product [Cylindrotheca closterium]
MVSLETHQAISENNPSSRSEMASLNKTYQINRTEEKWSMSRLSIKPSLKRIDPEEKKWCPSRREMASLQTYQGISENNPSSRSEMALLNNRHLITTDLSSHRWGKSIKQKRNGVALGVFNCCMLRLSRRMVTVVSIS